MCQLPSHAAANPMKCIISGAQCIDIEQVLLLQVMHLITHTIFHQLSVIHLIIQLSSHRMPSIHIMFLHKHCIIIMIEIINTKFDEKSTFLTDAGPDRFVQRGKYYS